MIKFHMGQYLVEMYSNRTTEEHIFKLVDESISENTFAELNP